MKNQINLLNKKNITIYTIIIIICSILVFEIGYCNTEGLRNFITKNDEVSYNFSFCRMIMYIIYICIYILFRKKYIEESLKTIKNKYKERIIYIAIITTIITIVTSIIICIVNVNLIRSISILLITIFLVSLFFIYVSNNVIKNVILISCTLGIVYTISADYNHQIDEKRHFISAFNISLLNFDYANNPITDKYIEEMPQLCKYTDIDSFLKEYKQEALTEVNKKDVKSTPAEYNFLTYIFPAIGIAIARFLGGSIIDMYILGRIMNLVLYTALICIALKIIPYKKNIFFVLAMMPYILLLGATYSIDGFCIGMTFIFIAYCLKLKKEVEIISLKQFLILIGLFILVLLAKNMAYLFVCVIVLMLPLLKTIKKNKKYIPIMIALIIIFCILTIVIAIHIKDTALTGDSRAKGEVNGSKQLELILTNPMHDIVLLIEHIKNTLLNFEWYEMLHYDIIFTRNSKYIMIPLMIFIISVSLTEIDYIFKKKDKIIMEISFFMVWGMTSLALYLSYTRIGALYIDGYQTRYILPVLPLLLFGVANNNIIIKQRKDRNMKIAMISTIFITIGIIQLILS